MRKLTKKRHQMATQIREQVKEDIRLIQDQNEYSDPRLKKDDFAFNYWVLGKLYSLDEEYILSQIVEYKDHGIDCFVHYEDSKELFIIQNKYYSETTPLDRKQASDFLMSPLSKLNSGTYGKKSKELQSIFELAKDDPAYKINLHFYLFNEKENADIERLFTDFNLDHKAEEGKPIIQSRLFYLSDISDKYYISPYKPDKFFEFTLTTNVSRMLMQILPEERDYRLPKGMIEAYYIMTPISIIYRMYESSQQKEYPLFKENIREYIGKSPINDGIKRTLESSKEERLNFFYYNNGITIICDKAKSEGMVQSQVPLKLTKPQVVNGCQTVNTIYEVIKNYADKDQSLVEKEFGDVYLMAKVLVKGKDANPDFYLDIVKYTNKQNALTEKAFTSNKEEFKTLQDSFEERGFLVLIQGSDKYQYEQTYLDKGKLNQLLTKSNKYSSQFDLSINRLSEVFIPLEKLLQVYVGFMTDGFNAYSKKSKLLKASTNKEGINFYEDYSLKVQDNITYENLLKLWVLFKKAEYDRSKTEKVPIPYYLVGFLGSFLPNKESESITNFLTAFFGQKKADLLKQYNFLSDLTGSYKIAYKDKHDLEYNDMIKQKIDIGILTSESDKLSNSINYKGVKKGLELLSK